MTTKEDKIKKDYFAGLSYTEIQKNNNITVNQLKYTIKKNGWKRIKKLAYKGNQNALGNNGGANYHNKRAVTTGEHENIFNGVLNDDEVAYLNTTNIEAKQELEQEIKILSIREKRMLKRIAELKKDNMTINTISETNSTSQSKIQNFNSKTTNTENTIISIQRIEEALTRVQEAKRRAIESLNRLKSEKYENEENRIQIINDLPKEEDDATGKN